MVEYSEMVAEAHAYARSRRDVSVLGYGSMIFQFFRGTSRPQASSAVTRDELRIVCEYLRSRSDELGKSYNNSTTGVEVDLVLITYHRDQLTLLKGTIDRAKEEGRNLFLNRAALVLEFSRQAPARIRACTDIISQLHELKRECDKLVCSISKCADEIDRIVSDVEGIPIWRRSARIRTLEKKQRAISRLVCRAGEHLRDLERRTASRDEILPEHLRKEILYSWTVKYRREKGQPRLRISDS